MSKKRSTPTELVPRADFIEPDQRASGRWVYGFADLEVGDQMRCPLKDGETAGNAGRRVTSAAICWKKKNKAAERAHIVFRSQRRSKYVLIERVA